MKFKFFFEWQPWSKTPGNWNRRKERLEIHLFEDFMWKPSLTRNEFLKEVGWLGFWLVYEGKFFKPKCWGPWTFQ